MFVESKQKHDVGPAHADPRVLRSRRMFTGALERLLAKREYETLSVQEIADEAMLNRATFYLHFPDKAALFEAMTEERFRDLVAHRGLSYSGCAGGLRAIALGVCDYLVEVAGSCPSRFDRLPLESAIIHTMEAVFREGASSHKLLPGLDPEMVGTAAAWAILGSAKQWLQMPNRLNAEKVAKRIEIIVKCLFESASDDPKASHRL